MNAPQFINLIAENLADEARALSPGEGRRRPIEVDATGLRRWLENFAALPALATEESDARLLLSVPARQLVVRWVGGRLGAELNGTFLAANVDEIETQLMAAAPAAAPEPRATVAPPNTPPVPRPRMRAQAWLLASLLALLTVVGWWVSQPETLEGVAWITDASERQTVLEAVAGDHASDVEKLHLDAATAHLTAADLEGQNTLSTTVRVGRQAGVAVLATEAGVLIQIDAHGQLRVNGTLYRRVNPGS